MTADEELALFNELMFEHVGFKIGDVVECIKRPDYDNGLRCVVGLVNPGDTSLLWVRYVVDGKPYGRPYRELIERLRPLEGGILSQIAFGNP